MKRLIVLFLIGACIGAPKWAAAQDLNRSLDEAKDLLNGMANGMLKTDLVQVGQRKIAAVRLRKVAGDLVPAVIPTPAPQAPSKVAPAPQAPSKIAPAPQAPSKIAPAPQAPSKVAPAPQAAAEAFSIFSTEGFTISGITRVALRNVLLRIADSLDDEQLDEKSPGDQEQIKDRALQALGLISLIQNPA